MKYQETPFQELNDPLLKATGVRVIIKREDLNHPHLSGNKWWKLRGIVEDARRQNKTTLLTFGGAYSNHIVATAAAAEEMGLQSVGIIRGEKVMPLNSTLAFAEKKGMQLAFISREDYRMKTDPEFLSRLSDRYNDPCIIPEGGTNLAAVQSVSEWGRQLKEFDFDYLCLPSGTGGTLAGLIIGLEGSREVIGYSVLKGNFMTDEVGKILAFSGNDYQNWRVADAYHFGGYAHSHPDLEKFIERQWKINHLPLEPVYSGKMLFGVYDMILTGRFPRSSTIMVLHTGGLDSMRQSAE